MSLSNADLRPGGPLEQRGVHLGYGGVRAWRNRQIDDAFAHAVARNGRSLAMDAAPTLATSPSNSIPAFLSQYIDPQVVEVVFTALKAAEIMGGEVQRGDWTTRTAYFKLLEYIGETSAYGDINNNGRAGVNAGFPQRQQWYFQTHLEYGEREAAEMSLAGLGDWVSRKRTAAQMVINRKINDIYFYGVTGLQNYGLLNDPSLPAYVTPYTKAAGGTGWAQATPNEVYADIQKLYGVLVTQTGGLVEMDMPMVLAMPPISSVALANANSFNVNVEDLLRKVFPNLRVETAVQYTTQAGNELQLIVSSYEGVDTAYPAYSEKLRNHQLIPTTSTSWAQKMSAGAWGAIIRRPAFIASMLGI